MLENILKYFITRIRLDFASVKFSNVKISYQTGITSSALNPLAFHFKILVTAEMAFSVGLIFSGSLEFGDWMISTNFGIAWAQIDA